MQADAGDCRWPGNRRLANHGHVAGPYLNNTSRIFYAIALPKNIIL
jgi:hypothetical protein